MESLIAGGAVCVVVGAILAILYRITMGERSTRKLEKLKEELEKQQKK